MRDSKLVEILQTITADEFKKLEKFAASSYFSAGRDLTHFIKILKTFHPDFSDKNFTMEYIYSKLYPERLETGKVQQTIKTLSSELILTCKKFFRQIEFEKDINRQNYYLCNQLRVRKLYKEFDKEYKFSLEQLNNSNKGGINDFIEKYYSDSVFRDYSLDRDDFINAFEYTLAADENIVSAALMNCFMIEDTKNISAAYNLPLRYSLMNNVVDNVDTEKILSQMKKNKDRFYPYVLIFYMIYKMNRHKDIREYFYELKNQLIKNKNLFGQSENYVFWNILLSYCTKNSLKRQEFFSIYDYMLNNKIHKKSGEDFHIVLFRNIITVSADGGNFQWLEIFIEKYSGELHIDHRKNMYNFSYAHLYFAKGDFEAALAYLQKVSYDLFIFKMDVRILLLKIYYELSYTEQSYSLLDSLLHFLKNTSEFSDSHKIACRNFIYNFKELLKLNLSKEINPHSISFLEKKIEGEITGNIGQNDWLLLKIAELKRK
ncbi:MAG TPA: hypothetical protein PK536_05635 [Ignavibacteria bacterium]|nr:hypothetical protein [Bacteroidota bacterium]HRI84912.1 hypothetical protein [Ignavibacteria bacterium]HRJ98454.1 hypothetical protein [Ignavibacteria bacterium]